jgi:hypothetical protein
MAEEIFEASLTPEILNRMRKKAVVSGKGTSAYGPLERSIEALKYGLKSPVFKNERMWSLLRGSYDVHVHSGPSSTTERLMDELDLAIHGCYVGQGGIVFKNHDSPSTRSAKIVQKVVDQWAEEHNKKKIEIFGGVVLNYTVGGLNPDAIISAYRLGGKYVWLPNLDANHHRRVVGQGEGQGIDVIDEKDRLVPKMKEVLEILAETDMVLGVGHQSTKERMIIVKEAVKMGCKRIEVNHVNYPLVWLTPEQCKMFADMGAYIGVYAMEQGVDYVIDDVVAIYKAVGPEKIVLASDCGHIENPYPLDGLRRLILAFLLKEVPDAHVKMMCQTNAYNLLH